jgi:hypothetical protein
MMINIQIAKPSKFSIEKSVIIYISEISNS